MTVRLMTKRFAIAATAVATLRGSGKGSASSVDR